MRPLEKRVERLEQGGSGETFYCWMPSGLSEEEQAQHMEDFRAERGIGPTADVTAFCWQG